MPLTVIKYIMFILTDIPNTVKEFFDSHVFSGDSNRSGPQNRLYLHPLHMRDIMMWYKIRFSWQGVMRDANKKITMLL
jgi:hypothetical protein